MSTKLILVIVGVAAVGGGAWYATQHRDHDGHDRERGSHAETRNGGQEASTNTDAFSGIGSIAKLVALGGSAKCEFESSSEEHGLSRGTLYYDDDRFRVEAVADFDGQQSTSNLLNDGTRTYIWGQTPEGEMALIFNNEETETSMEGFALHVYMTF